jgi:hypothetical protein
MSLILDAPQLPRENELFADTRTASDRKVSERAARASRARHANTRRQKIDPTTCDRDYSTAELEFMRAIQAYKQANGRQFPTWGEVLEVLQDLGYRKPA